MANDARIAIWSGVPDGSSLLISTKGTTKKKLITAHAFLLRSDGMEQIFPDGLVQPGPVSITLESPNTYSILVDLVYVTSGTAEVTAQVVDPGKKRIPADGTTDKRFNSTLAGSQGQTLGLTFIIITA
jgi:hypothetical protein